MIGWAVRQLMLWGVLAAVLFVIAHRMLPPAPIQTSPSAAPAAAVATSPEPTAGRTRSAVPNSLVLRANSQGHVFADAVVNGAPVRFVVDTGATMVALTMRDAQAAGIDPNQLNFSLRFSTANGVARAAPVKLREVRIGPLVLAEVDAVVHENLTMSLLGQSFLTRLDGYEMRDGVLTLSFW